MAIGEEKSKEESQRSVEELGIGTNCIARKPRSSGSGHGRKTTVLRFTRAQLIELYQQTPVSKFIAARFSLPCLCHLRGRFM